jgi:hypothetical protein
MKKVKTILIFAQFVNTNVHVVIQRNSKLYIAMWMVITRTSKKHKIVVKDDKWIIKRYLIDFCNIHLIYSNEEHNMIWVVLGKVNINI